MKVKRQKRNRKIMQLYSSCLNFREPYQLLVDGTFVQVGLQFRLDLKSLTATTLSSQVKLCTTKCIVDELRSLGEEYMGAVLASKRFEFRPCAGHSSARECIADLIGTHNQNHYIVATQDQDLRSQLRSIPGTPLLYLSGSVLVLEPHSSETLAYTQSKEQSKLAPSNLNYHLTNAEASAPDDPLKAVRPAMPKRRAKAKQPNPLSVKKPKFKKQHVHKPEMIGKAESRTHASTVKKRRK